jgi:hypothetical protein
MLSLGVTFIPTKLFTVTFIPTNLSTVEWMSSLWARRCRHSCTRYRSGVRAQAHLTEHLFVALVAVGLEPNLLNGIQLEAHAD